MIERGLPLSALGSIFTGWIGCDAVSGTRCTVGMNTARSVTVKFTGLPLGSRVSAAVPPSASSTSRK
jgi:hypothetical protein